MGWSSNRVLPILHGGTGNTTAQAAIDALTNVGPATNEHILTKNTGTGSAEWKVNAAGGGSSKWTEDGGGIFTYLTDTARDIAIGGSAATSPFYMDVGDGSLTINRASARIQTGVNASDKIILKAYDTVTGPAYVDFFTLTAGNPPTADLDVLVTHDGKNIVNDQNAITFTTGTKTFSANTLDLKGSTSGEITLNAPAVAGTNTITFPADSDEVVLLDTVQILTNKDIDGVANPDLTVYTANITDANVTYAKIQNVSAQNLILGRKTVGAGVVEELNAAEARTAINVDVAGTDNSTDVTLIGTPDYITIAGQVITRNQIDLAADVTGELPTANIADDAVTYAKIQDVTQTDVFLGRDTVGAGVIEELTPTAARAILNVEDNANAYIHPHHSGDIVSVNDGDTTIQADAVTYAKMQNVVADNVVLGNIAGAGGVVAELTGANVKTIIGLIDLTADVTGVLPFANGGTNGATQQLGLNALTNVAAASTGYVLKKSAGGDAVFEADTGPASAPVDATYLVNTANATLTNEVVVSALTAGLTLQGDNAAARTITLGQQVTFNDLVDVDVPIANFTADGAAVVNVSASQTLTNKTLDSGTVISASPTINDGIKVTFNPDGTNAGINVGQHTADPSAAGVADVWYNSTDKQLVAYQNLGAVPLINHENILSHGAIPNDVGSASANDTAFAAAVTAAAASGKAIYVPAGTFYISTPILVTSTINIRFLGEGVESTIEQTGVLGESCIEYSGSLYGQLEQIHLRGSSSSSGSGVKFLASSGNSRVTRCWFQSLGGPAIDISGSVAITIEGNWIKDNWDDGIQAMTAPANAIVIRDNLLLSNQGHGIQISGSGNVISGNTIETNQLSGVMVDSSVSTGNEGLSIVDNYFEGNWNAQIRLSSRNAVDQINGTVIEGNYLFSNYAGAGAGTALILGENSTPAYTGGITHTRIVGNHYEYSGASITHSIDLGDEARMTYIQISGLSTDDNKQALTNLTQLGDDYSVHALSNGRIYTDTATSPGMKIASVDGSDTNPILALTDENENDLWQINASGLLTHTYETTATSGVTITQVVDLETSGTAVDGFGPGVQFKQDGNIVGQYSFVRDNVSDTTGEFCVSVNVAGMMTNKLFVNTEGVQIGTATEPTGTSTATLTFGDNMGVPVPGTSTACIYLNSGTLYGVVNGGAAFALDADHSTPVTLAGENYLSIDGSQVITAAAVDLSGTNVTGDLPVANLAGGSGASATTFWAGDGSWKIAELVFDTSPVLGGHLEMNTRQIKNGTTPGDSYSLQAYDTGGGGDHRFIRFTNNNPPTMEFLTVDLLNSYSWIMSNLTADVDITLPPLIASDTFVFEAHEQTLSEKSFSDLYLNLNYEYATDAAVNTGFVANYDPTTTTDTVAGSGFAAGVDASTDPTVGTTGAATFAAGDIVMITSADTIANNGYFEVQGHAANVLTIKGVGVTPTTQDFVKDQFTTDTGTNGAITKVALSVLRAGTDGKWEEFAGNSTTGAAFTDVNLWTDDGTTTYPTDATTDFAIGGTDSTAPLHFDEGVGQLTITGTTNPIDANRTAVGVDNAIRDVAWFTARSDQAALLDGFGGRIFFKSGDTGGDSNAGSIYWETNGGDTSSNVTFTSYAGGSAEVGITLTPDDVILAGSDSTAPFVLDKTTGQTTHTGSSVPISSIRTSSQTAATRGTHDHLHKTDQPMSDGFGLAETFSVQDDAAGPFIIGQHSWILDDASERVGRFIVTTYDAAGSPSAKMYVDHRGVIIGSGGVPTSSTAALMFGNNNGGTDPVPASNQAGIYAKADGGGNVEMWAIDEDGTTAQLTAAAAGDDLGNHTATTQILAGTHGISFATTTQNIDGVSGAAQGLKYSVPSGEYHEFLINSLPQLTLTGTQINCEGNTLVSANFSTGAIDAITEIDSTIRKGTSGSTKLATTTDAAVTNGNIAAWDVNGNLVDGGAAGAGDMILASIQTNTGLKSFNNQTLEVMDTDNSNGWTFNAGVNLSGDLDINIPFTSSQDLVGATFAQTLTSKIIDANNNTITNIGTTELSNNGVTFAKMQNINQHEFITRTGVGSGDPEAVSSSSAWDILTQLTTRGDILTRGAVVDQRLPLGATGTFLKSDGTDAVWAAGGTTTPGGADTQVQYNNAGAFGANSSMTYDAGGGVLTVTGLTATDTVLVKKTGSGAKVDLIDTSTTHGRFEWTGTVVQVGSESANDVQIIRGGTAVAEFDLSSTAGATRFLLYDIDAAALVRVHIGTAGTGPNGTTDHMLYIK